jgi:hypothetical protein
LPAGPSTETPVDSGSVGDGPPPWDLYALMPATAVFGVLTVEPGGATRKRFDA